MPPAYALSPLKTGEEYYRKGLMDMARAEFEKDLQANPKSARSHFYLGMICFSRGQIGEAIAHYQKAVALDYFIPGGHYALGICHKKNGDFEAAEKAFGKAVKVAPMEAKNYFNWGVCLVRLARYSDAVYAFSHAVSLDDGNIYSHYNLADVYRLTGDHHEAIVQYDVVLRDKPQFAPARTGKGLALEALGRDREAVVEFLQAEELDPRDPRVWERLAVLYAKLGENGKAEKYRRRGETLPREEPEAVESDDAGVE